eukprot:99188_1
MIKDLNTQINNQKYEQFYKCVHQICRKGRCLPGYNFDIGKLVEENVYKIQFMIKDNDLTELTFPLWSKHEFCQLVTKYYCMTKEDDIERVPEGAMELWEAINKELQKNQINNNICDLENTLKSFKTQENELKNECKKIIGKK